LGAARKNQKRKRIEASSEHRAENQLKNLQSCEINLNTEDQKQRDSKVGGNDPLNSLLEVKEITSPKSGGSGKHDEGGENRLKDLEEKRID